MARAGPSSHLHAPSATETSEFLKIGASSEAGGVSRELILAPPLLAARGATNFPLLLARRWRAALHMGSIGDDLCEREEQAVQLGRARVMG